MRLTRPSSTNSWKPCRRSFPSVASNGALPALNAIPILARYRNSTVSSAATASPVNVGLTHQTMRSTNMGVSPAKIVQSLLTNPADPELVKSLTTPDVTYVSPNENNPTILPWTGTNKGPETMLGYSKLLPRHGKPKTLKYAT